MDKETKIQDIKDRIQRYCEDRDWDQFHTPKELAIGVITEASEVLEHFRFKSEEEIEQFFKDPLKRENIEDEMADVLYFLFRFLFVEPLVQFWLALTFCIFSIIGFELIRIGLKK